MATGLASLTDQAWFGIAVPLTALLVVLLPGLIARTAHARSEYLPSPYVGANFRGFLNYVLSGRAWRGTSTYGKVLIFAYRAALVAAAAALAMLAFSEVRQLL